MTKSESGASTQRRTDGMTHSHLRFSNSETNFSGWCAVEQTRITQSGDIWHETQTFPLSIPAWENAMEKRELGTLCFVCFDARGRPETEYTGISMIWRRMKSNEWPHSRIRPPQRHQTKNTEIGKRKMQLGTDPMTLFARVFPGRRDIRGWWAVRAAHVAQSFCTYVCVFVAVNSATAAVQHQFRSTLLTLKCGSEVTLSK